MSRKPYSIMAHFLSTNISFHLSHTESFGPENSEFKGDLCLGGSTGTDDDCRLSVSFKKVNLFDLCLGGFTGTDDDDCIEKVTLCSELSVCTTEDLVFIELLSHAVINMFSHVSRCFPFGHCGYWRYYFNWEK